MCDCEAQLLPQRVVVRHSQPHPRLFSLQSFHRCSQFHFDRIFLLSFFLLIVVTLLTLLTLLA